MKYFIYCRKSSEEDSKQAQSLETQQRILMDLVERLDLEVVDVINESKSARKDQNRPLFAEMLSRVERGEANGILVVHTDRLARNFIDAGFIIKFLESGILKEVRTPTSVFNNVPSLMYMGFDFVFAAHYSRDLSLKVRAGNESKLLKGEYPTFAPLGYINIRPGKGIEPDPIRAPFITQAFELYSTGQYSVKALSIKLAESGFRSRNGRLLKTSAIHRIITNPEYYGIIKRKDKLYAGKHTPLVSKEVFDQVQEIIQGKSRPRKQIHKFVYRDYLICEQCGCKITAGISKGKYIYYRCTNSKKVCDQHKSYWKEKIIESEFQNFFDQFTLDKDLANASFELYKSKKTFDASKANHSRMVVEEQLQTLKEKLSRLENMYIDGRIDSEKFDERKTEFSNEIAQLKTIQKQKIHRQEVRILELLERLKNQSIKLSEIFKNGDNEVKRDLIKSVLWNSNFSDGKITSTRLTALWKPLENLNKTTNLENWRKGRDSNPRWP